MEAEKALYPNSSSIRVLLVVEKEMSERMKKLADFLRIPYMSNFKVPFWVFKLMHRQYLAIDLKSFYASVECVERKLDPLGTCLVVADASRTEKTICLAVSQALKEYGTGGSPRLFEVV